MIPSQNRKHKRLTEDDIVDVSTYTQSVETSLGHESYSNIITGGRFSIGSSYSRHESVISDLNLQSHIGTHAGSFSNVRHNGNSIRNSNAHGTTIGTMNEIHNPSMHQNNEPVTKLASNRKMHVHYISPPTQTLGRNTPAHKNLSPKKTTTRLPKLTPLQSPAFTVQSPHTNPLTSLRPPKLAAPSVNTFNRVQRKRASHFNGHLSKHSSYHYGTGDSGRAVELMYRNSTPTNQNHSSIDRTFDRSPYKLELKTNPNSNYIPAINRNDLLSISDNLKSHLHNRKRTKNTEKRIKCNFSPNSHVNTRNNFVNSNASYSDRLRSSVYRNTQSTIESSPNQKSRNKEKKENYFPYNLPPRSKSEMSHRHMLNGDYRRRSLISSPLGDRLNRSIDNLKPTQSKSTYEEMSVRNQVSSIQSFSSPFSLRDGAFRCRVKRQASQILCDYTIIIQIVRFLVEMEKWRNDIIFNQDLHKYLAVSYDWYHSISAYLIDLRKQNMSNISKRLGINFVRVPAGVYRIGSTSIISTSYYNIPTQFVKVDEFFISDRVLRVSDWKKIESILEEEIIPAETHKRKYYSLFESDKKNEQNSKEMHSELSFLNRAHTRNILSEDQFDLCQKNSILLPVGIFYSQKDTKDEDPLLTIPFHKCAEVANALGATIPTWQQWEIAARGPDGRLYPWGDVPLSLEDVGREKIKYTYIIQTLKESGFKAMTKRGFVDRATNLSPYQSYSSQFGLRDLLHFSKEFNICPENLLIRCKSKTHASYDEIHARTYVLRSLCYLGPQTTFVPSPENSDQSPLEVKGFKEMAQSEHRSFNGPPLSACEPAGSINHSEYQKSFIDHAIRMDVTAPSIAGGQYFHQNATFRLVFNTSFWYQSHPLFPLYQGGFQECCRCGTQSRYHPLCLQCMLGNGRTNPKWFSLLGRQWQNIQRIVGVTPDMQKRIPDWTRHRFHYIYLEGIIVSSTLTKNEPKSIHDLMCVEEISFVAPNYTLELNGYTFEYGYLRVVIEGIYWGQSLKHIQQLYGEGKSIEDCVYEYNSPFIHDSYNFIFYFNEGSRLERISVRECKARKFEETLDESALQHENIQESVKGSKYFTLGSMYDYKSKETIQRSDDGVSSWDG